MHRGSRPIVWLDKEFFFIFVNCSTVYSKKSSRMRPPPDAAEAPAAPAIIFVNGKKHLLPPGRGDATLLQYLRGENENEARKETEDLPFVENPLAFSASFSLDLNPPPPPGKKKTSR